MQKWMLAFVAVVGLASTSGASAGSLWSPPATGEQVMTSVPSQARQCSRLQVSKGTAASAAASQMSRKKSASGAAIRVTSN